MSSKLLSKNNTMFSLISLICKHFSNTSEGYFNFKLVSRCIEQRAKTCKLCINYN